MTCVNFQKIIFERVDKALKTEEDYFYDSKEIDANLQPRKSE